MEQFNQMYVLEAEAAIYGVELTDDESIKKMNRLLDLLEDDDDVQATYHNWDE